MIPEFDQLDEEEVELMFKVPMLVAILVAGADSKIDNSEMREAIKVISLKPQKARKELVEYYKLVAEDFEDKLKLTIYELPSDAMKRSDIIIEDLKKLNSVLPKLDKRFAIKFYESMKEISKKVAESSGGVFGFMSVGYEESKVVDLKMIKDPSRY